MASDPAGRLRRRAEKIVRADEARTAAFPASDETQRVLHVLRVHQVELQMQNEELRRTQAALEASQRRQQQVQEALQQANDELELRVRQRTRDLENAVSRLKAEAAARLRMEIEWRATTAISRRLAGGEIRLVKIRSSAHQDTVVSCILSAKPLAVAGAEPAPARP